MNEATMTDADMKQRENIVKSMKKSFKDFRKRYGANAKNVMYATATKMAMKEAVKDEADKGEYDYEGDMAKSSLRTIARNAEMMHDMLGEDTNLPEWVASKITLAEDYIVSAAQYMQSEMTEEAQLQELDTDTYRRAGNARIDQGNAATTQKDQDKKFAKGTRLHKFAAKQEKRPGQSFFGKGGPSGNPIKKMKEEVELDEISSYKASRAADKSWFQGNHHAATNHRFSDRKLRTVAGDGSKRADGKLGDKSHAKAQSQLKKFNDYARKRRNQELVAKHPNLANEPRYQDRNPRERTEEYNATPFRNTERGVRGSKPAGQPRTSNSRQFFRPPEGFTKKGIEKGGGVKTVYHYKGKSSAPVGATMKMGGVKVNLGKTPTKRRPQEGSK